MTLSHLIQLKPRLLCSKIRFSQSTKWLSSSTSISSPEKKSTALSMRKASSVESFVNKYRETRPGISRTVTIGQNKIGRSFHTMKEIMLNLKEKIIGKSGAASQSNGPNKFEVSAPKSDLSDGNNLSASTTETLNESLTLEKKDIDATTNDVKTCSDLGNSESCQIKSSVQSSIQTPVKGSHMIEKSACQTSLYSTAGECSSVSKIDLPGKRSKINEKDHEDNIMNSSGSLKIVGTLNGPLQSEESSILIRELKSDPKPQVKKILHGIISEKLGSTGSQSQCDKMPSNSESNLGSENEIVKSKRSGLYINPVQKDMGLQELAVKCLSERLSVHPKQPDEAFSGTLLRSEVDPNSKAPQSQTKKLLHQFSEQMVTEVKGESQSESAKKAIRLKELFKKRMDHPEAREMMTDIKREILTRNIFKDSSSNTQEEDAKDSNLSGLLNCLKKLSHREQLGSVQPQGSIDSIKLDQLRNSDLIGGVQSQGEPQLSDNKGKQTLLNGQAMAEKKEKERGLDREVLPCNMKSTVKHVLDENRAILRFLQKAVKEYDIATAFTNRDDIVKIECSSGEGSALKTAHVYFKTRDGLQEALKNKYLIINNQTVTIEAASSSLDSLSNRICIPNLIGDPDAPVMLLKNPSKTVMVKELTDDISSHHIQEALLAFSKSEISSFFFGSSNSAAYVEFKTEEGKERALEEQSIWVQGKPLSIFRVDAPRTTVVRISNAKETQSILTEIVGLCKSSGQVKNVFSRNICTVDVHFHITEWPNMLKILNRLNGQIVNGHRLQAKPAPVFPPEIIHALWGHPEERRRLKGLMHNLIQKLDEDYLAKSDILDLASRYYRHDEA